MSVADSDRESLPVVNLVSETEFGSKGHGVHTAFIQTLAALEDAGFEVQVNGGDECDIVHVETMGLSSLYRLMRSKNRAVITAHIVPDSLVGSFMLAPLWLPIAEWYMRGFYQLADEVLAVSPGVLAGLREMDVTVPARVVPNAIDVSAFAPQDGWREQIREAHGIPEDRFVALCVGQIQPRKGIHDFIATARSMPDVTFIWVGGMPFRRLTDHYRDMQDAVSSAPENCLFVGEKPYDDTVRYYASADCLFFPSLQETFGFAVIEAAAAGLPLVVRDLDTYRQLFEGAYLVGAGSDFAAPLNALRTDRKMRAEYASRARTMAARFNTSRQAEQLGAVYADVLERPEAVRSRSARRLRPVLRFASGGWGPHR